MVTVLGLCISVCLLPPRLQGGQRAIKMASVLRRHTFFKGFVATWSLRVPFLSASVLQYYYKRVCTFTRNIIYRRMLRENGI